MRALLLLLLPLCGACASGPRVIANADPTADFGAYRTFGFPAELGTDGPEYSSLLSQFLRAATTRELEARGYRLAEEPDLLVDFYVHTEEKLETSRTPDAYYGYRHYDWRFHTGYETSVSQYTEGTLNVDLVDRREKKLVWEGAVIGRVTDERRRNLQESVDRAIAEVFEEYPYVVRDQYGAAPFLPASR